MNKPSVAIVTCYHFDDSPKNQVAYFRLLRSICESVQQLQNFGPNSGIVLVANGTGEQPGTAEKAIPPAKVIEAVKVLVPELKNGLIHPCSLPRNKSNTGALNRGIDAALHEIEVVEWIASVQSSAVIKPGWLDELLGSGSIDPTVGALFGRIFIEEEQKSIWTDGHILKKGRTYDANNRRMASEKNLCSPGQFPCLSACVFRRSLVEKMWDYYGDFLCANLCHYGDCTDVALRARSVDPTVVFKYSEKAQALKRLPEESKYRVTVSQLMAASLYYSPDRRKESETLLQHSKKYSEHLDTARSEAERRLAKEYSPKSVPAPRGTVLDLIW